MEKEQQNAINIEKDFSHLSGKKVMLDKLVYKVHSVTSELYEGKWKAILRCYEIDEKGNKKYNNTATYVLGEVFQVIDFPVVG